jgi:hypothetical protein
MATYGNTGKAITSDVAYEKGDGDFDVDAHIIDADNFFAKTVDHMTTPVVYKYKGTVFFTYTWNGDRHGMIFDRPHLEMAYSRLSSIALNRAIAPAYRSTGLMGNDPVDISRGYYAIEAEIAKEVLAHYPEEDGGIARRMKTARSMMENNYHLHAVPPGLESGEAERFETLRKSLDEMNTGGIDWYAFLTSLGYTDRISLDLAYLFHIIPTQDRDPLLLFANTHKKMHAPKVYDPKSVERFLAFTKAIDFAMECYTSGKEPNYTCDPSIQAAMPEIIRSCIKIRGYVPREEFWGKYCIDGHYPYLLKANFAHLEAKDATRVAADRTSFFHSRKAGIEARADSNELLNAVMNSGKFSNGMTADEARKAWAAGRVPGDNIADMAAKAENSKPAASARETVSWNEFGRAFMSEADACVNMMLNNFKSIAMGQSPTELEKTLARLLAITSGKKPGIVMSLDVTGWSPEAYRDMFIRHHDTILSYFEKFPGTSVRTLWDFLAIGLRKRGLNVIADFVDGMIQGWTGRLDCALHMHILLWLTYDLRCQGLITNQMGYHGLVLIDDGVLASVSRCIQYQVKLFFCDRA